MAVGGGWLAEQRSWAWLAVGLFCLALWAVAAWRESLTSAAPPSPPAPLAPNDIPFPAVTVCPAERIRPGLPRFQRETAKEYLCSGIYGSTRLNLKEGKILKESMPTLEEVIKDCRWEEKPINCSLEFQEIYTEDGVCFSFNMLPPKNLVKNDTLYVSDLQIWAVEGGYPEGVDYPRRMGPGTGLRLELASTRRNTSEQDPCGVASPGFKVFLHDPSDYPLSGNEQILANFFEEREVFIEPRLRIEIREKHYWSHGCTRDYHHGLGNYLTYSRTKCRRDCIREVAIDNCSCIPFWLTEPNPPQDQRICGPFDRQCLSLISTYSGYVQSDRHDCGCSPECWSLTYNPVTMIGVSFEPRNNTLNPYTVITIKPNDIVDVVPQSYIPISVEEHGSIGAVLLISGVCLILYLGLMVIVSNQERQPKETVPYSTEMRPAVVSVRNNDQDPPLLDSDEN